MIGPRVFKAAAAFATLSVSVLCAADFSSYRGFEFGASLAAAAKQAGMKPSEARLVHQRPAVIEELDWRPVFAYQANASKADPLREALLRFYNGQLFQIAITYDRQRLLGMTEADMVKVISLTYGAATEPAVEIPYRSNFGEVAKVIARWENPEYSYDLIRTGDQASFAFVLSRKSLDAQAQAAIAEASRLDALEAPQRAIEAQKRQEAEDRLVLDKARSANVPNFRP
jgi:hypothetical protein